MSPQPELKLVFPQTDLAQMIAERREMRRLQSLIDQWLGAELLRLARLLRGAVPEFAVQRADTGTGTMLWDYVPSLAYRLGGMTRPDEATDAAFNRLQGEHLRNVVATTMPLVNREIFAAVGFDARFRPDDILFHDHRGGNPIVFALDRIAPPGDTSRDAFSQGIRTLSLSRGFEAQSTWHPGLMEPLDGEDDYEEEPRTGKVLLYGAR